MGVDRRFTNRRCDDGPRPDDLQRSFHSLNFVRLTLVLKFMSTIFHTKKFVLGCRRRQKHIFRDTYWGEKKNEKSLRNSKKEKNRIFFLLYAFTNA